jgi:hypothetical protein
MRFFLLKTMALAALILGLAACESVPPETLSNTLMNAIGTVDVGGATSEATLELHNLAGGISAEIYDKRTHRLIASAHLVGPDGYANFMSLHQFLEGVRGPLRARRSGSAITVTQSGVVEKPLGRIQSSRVPHLTQGALRLDGGRRMTYNLGLVEQGLQGRVRVRMMDAQGNIKIFFDGQSVHEAVSRYRYGYTAVPMQTVVGTSVSGQITGAVELGGAWFGGNEARLFIKMPYRSGGIEVEGRRQAFTFNPERDVTPPGGAGQMTVTHDSENYVRVDDSFSAQIALNNVDVSEDSDEEKRANGRGNVRYHLIVEVRQSTIRVYGQSQMDAALSLSDGQSATFRGSNPHIHTELEW